MHKDETSKNVGNNVGKIDVPWKCVGSCFDSVRNGLITLDISMAVLGMSWNMKEVYVFNKAIIERFVYGLSFSLTCSFPNIRGRCSQH